MVNVLQTSVPVEIFSSKIALPIARVCVDITLSEDQLVVTSPLEEHNTTSCLNSGVPLVLDRRNRVFRTFLDGVATIATFVLTDEWVWGDYCRQVADDQCSFELLLFSSTEKTTQNTEMNARSKDVAVTTEVSISLSAGVQLKSAR